MDEREFASKLLEDKVYLQQVLMNAPEDVLKRMAAENKAAADAHKRGEPSNTDNIGETLCEYFVPAAQAMGYTMDPAMLAAEIDSQLKPRGVFGMLKYTLRFGKAVNKANKQYGIK